MQTTVKIQLAYRAIKLIWISEIICSRKKTFVFSLQSLTFGCTF